MDGNRDLTIAFGPVGLAGLALLVLGILRGSRLVALLGLGGLEHAYFLGVWLCIILAALAALVSFAFAHTLNVFTGFAGLIIGTIAILIDARTGGKWLLSVGALVLFGLITAVNVS